MKEVTIITAFRDLANRIQQVYDSLRMAISGESLRNQALQELLMEKGVITEAELNTKMGDVIKKINAKEPEIKVEEAKPELIVPTPEQTAQINTEAK